MELESCPHIAQNVNASLQGRNIYKDQCTKCFADPLDSEGINLCLTCYNGGCVSDFNHSLEHYQKTQHAVALNIKMRIEIIQSSQKDSEITKLAIGVPGGIGQSQEKIHHDYSLYCYQCQKTVDASSINHVVQSVQNSNSSFTQAEVQVWEDEIFPCEHTLTLNQQEKILNSEHLSHCTQCNLSKNLWLCMTCGNIGCGRKQYDGSGGNGHGIEHFKSTKHPLAVKMGTITPDGNASLYCYSCDSDVKDDHIAQHLINFGLDINRQSKTEKTMTELNLTLNLSVTLSSIIEEGKVFNPLFGPYNTGLANIGNSCYLNSVLQVLFQLPEFQKQYYEQGQVHQKNCTKFTPTCLSCQLSKLGYGLCSGKYSIKKEHKVSEHDPQVLDEKQKYYQEGIKIHDIKQILAKGNKEFQGNKMQDSLEYLQHLFSLLQKHEKQEKLEDSVKPFQFTLLTKLKCSACGLVKLQEMKTTEVKIPVRHPTKVELETAAKEKAEKAQERANQKKLQETGSQENATTIEINLDFEGPIYNTTFEESVQMFANGELVELNCPTCKGPRQFFKQELFKSTPKYLLVVMTRFVEVNWVPKKLNAMIDIKEEFDFGKQVYQGLLPGETLFQENNQGPVQPAVDQVALSALTAMGFTENRCTRALLANNNNADAATNWLFERMDDASLDLPIESNNNNKNPKQQAADPANVQLVMSMGFSEKAASIALKLCDNNVERAVDYLFSHENVEAEAEIQEESKEENVGAGMVEETGSQYRLKGVFVHLGTSAQSGHYVSYVKRNDKWLLFNDSKVAETEEPLLGKGYFYLFERKN